MEKLITKRNGTQEEFQFEKIENAVRKAFKAQAKHYTDEEKTIETVLSVIKNTLQIKKDDVKTVEDIQDIVEKSLMCCGQYDIAKDYIIYRKTHEDSRFIASRIDYMNQYALSNANAATSSETDANANVTMKNVANLEGEVYKTTNRIIQRQRMKNELNALFPEVAKQYEQDLDHHTIYVHDEATTPVLKQYCMAVSLYPLMMEGVGNIDGVTPSAPNDLQSFSGQISNLIFLLSAQCKGAVACLYGKQPLIINDKEVEIKNFVQDNWTNPIKANGAWEYCKVDGYSVFEDGKNTAIKKVFRKKYNDKIYKITSNKGFVALTSKDHVFKVLRRGNILEVPAEDLQVFDTVFVDNNIPVDFTSKDFQEGRIKGMLLGDGCLTQPDMIQLSVNYEQEYYGDIFNTYAKSLYGDTLYQCKGHKCYQYETHKKEFSKELKNGIIGSNTYDKDIDTQGKSIDYISGILDGVLSADGADHHSIVITLANSNLINTIWHILTTLRVPFSYKEIPEHDNKSALYQLTISTEVLKYTPNLRLKLKKDKLPKETYYYSGFSRIRDVANKKTIVPTGQGRFMFPDYKVDVITSIETFDNDEDYVYEIETESHWYNCGGFITHNCSEYFIALNYYAGIEYGKDWYKHLDDGVSTSACLKKKTVRTEILKAFKQFV